MATLLLIDDDVEVLSINKKYLSGEGYTVYATSDSQKGVALLKAREIDCVILDIMMSGMNGYDVCKAIRTFSSVPIIFLTGMGSEDDKIVGLESGADDYIVKPYSLRELKARINVQLRHFSLLSDNSVSNILQFGDLVIDQISHKVTYKNKDLGLANREYEVLLFLAMHPNRDVTFQELGITLFGTYQEEDRKIIMVNMSRLRKKMNIDFDLENMIQTVWSKGYRFIVS